MRILLVDDHPIVRRGVRAILTERIHGATIGEADDAAAALHLWQERPWDLVIIDLSLPGVGGLDLVKQLRADNVRVPILVLSMHPAKQFARRVLRAGAQGYVTKDRSATELVVAIEHVKRGQRYVSGGETDDSPDDSAGGGRPAHETLSDREYQVLRMIGSGLTVSDIGRQLGLSVKTISTYRARLLEKLGMHTNAEVMRYAIENRFIES